MSLQESIRVHWGGEINWFISLYKSAWFIYWGKCNKFLSLHVSPRKFLLFLGWVEDFTFCLPLPFWYGLSFFLHFFFFLLWRNEKPPRSNVISGGYWSEKPFKWGLACWDDTFHYLNVYLDFFLIKKCNISHTRKKNRSMVWYFKRLVKKCFHLWWHLTTQNIWKVVFCLCPLIFG